MQQIKYSIKFSPSSIPNEQFIIVWLLQIIIIYNYRNFSILFVFSLDYASLRDQIRRLIIERRIYISFRTTYGDCFRHKGFFPPLLLSTRLDSTKIDPSSNRKEFMSFSLETFSILRFSSQRDSSSIIDCIQRIYQFSEKIFSIHEFFAFPLNELYFSRDRSSIANGEFINFQRKSFRSTNFSFLL